MSRRGTARRAVRKPARGRATRTVAAYLRVVGLALLCGKVALVPLVFDYGADLPFVVPKALLSHALAYLLVAVLLALFVANGRGFFVWSPLHIPVLSFFAVATAATASAADLNLGVFGTHSRMLGLGTIADGVVLYFGIVLLVRQPLDGAAIVASGLLASLPVLAYELVQFLGRDPLHWSLDSTQRPFSTLGESTALAQYLSVLAVGSGALALLAPIDRRVRVALIALALMLIAGTAITSTRSPLIGLGAATVVTIVLIWRIHPSRRARIMGLAGATIGGVVVAGVLLLTPLGTRFSMTIVAPTFDSQDELIVKLEPSAAARVTLYQIALQMVLERPLLGYGPDNFVTGVPQHRPALAPVQVRQNVATSAHSWVANVATGTGLVGLAAYVAVPLMALALISVRSFRPLAIAAMAMLASYLGTGMTTVDEFGTEWLFWATAGMVAAVTAAPAVSKQDEVVAAKPGRGRTGSPRAAPVSGWIAPVACVAVGVLIAATPLTAFDASRSARASQTSRLQGSVLQAISLGLKSTSEDPRRADYWQTLGLAYVAGNKLGDAAKALDRASKLSPYDVRFLGDEVRAYLLLAQAGDTAARAEAIRIADLAIKTDPNNPRAQLTKAVAMQVAGYLPEALTTVRRALELDPESNNPELYITAAQILSASGQTSDSIRVSRDGIGVLGQARDSVGLRVELARALMASGQLTEALKEIDVALALLPGEPTATSVRAEIQAAIARGG